MATKDFISVLLFNSTSLSGTIDREGNPFASSGVNLTANAYTNATGSTVFTVAAAATALTNVRHAIAQLATDRATRGANATRLNFTADQLAMLQENLTVATSRIKDVKVAEESTQFARYTILVQAGTAMLAQANPIPQSMLQLWE